MKTLACVSGVELLMDYLEGVLPADLNAALAEHVLGCPRCAAFVDSYRATPRLMRDATLATMPDGLEASLQAFLRERTTAFRS
jgi:anti-sigma factor RsiW